MVRAVERQRSIRAFFAILLLFTATNCFAAKSDDALYSAEMSDGQRISGGHLTNWGTTDHPRLNNRPLHDRNNPILWLERETTERPVVPAAYLEMVGGDVMPGRAVGLGDSFTIDDGQLGSYLLVEPAMPVSFGDGPARSTIRISTRWLRRVVWQRRSTEQYAPATLFLKNGRQLAYLAVRFQSDRVSVLTGDGRQEFATAELAELDMPPADWWNAYFEQLSLLSPECTLRLVRLETLDGLRATISPDRLQVIPSENEDDQDSWVQAVEPAWSLDTLFLRHARILTRHYFGPHQVPLSIVEPSATRLRSALAVGWPPQIDRNVQGGVLVSGGKRYAWGIGTQAYTEMEFSLPSCAVSFHSMVGLDRVVGRGGCARALVYTDDMRSPPLFRSDHLIGSASVVDTGQLPLANRAPPHSPSPLTPLPPGERGSVGNSQNKSTAGKLIIVSHPDSGNRPAGADPLDIRDVVDWLEPQVNLDLERLRGEVRDRLPAVLPSLSGWTIGGGLSFTSRWDKISKSFHFEFRPEGSQAVLSRSIQIEPNQNWLLIYASRNAENDFTAPTRMLVQIDGRPAGDFNVPSRQRSTAEHVALPVDKLHGQQISLEIHFMPATSHSFVDWRSIELVERLPGDVRN